jgi:uncharacterized protein YlxW (UPF0749 family)
MLSLISNYRITGGFTMRCVSILIILTALVTWVFPTVSAAPADTPTDLKKKIEKLEEEVNTLDSEVQKLNARIHDWYRDNSTDLNNLLDALGHKLETKQNWQTYYDFYSKKMNDPPHSLDQASFGCRKRKV